MSGYFPAIDQIRKLVCRATDGPAGELVKKGLSMFKPGFLMRTDGLPVDESLLSLRENYNKTGDPQVYALHERTASVSDLTEDLYNRFYVNPASIANWLPPVVEAFTGSDVLIPPTSIVRLPIELAQYIRMEYPETDQNSRDVFNKIVYKLLDLHEDSTYFLKTGTFSSKFEFGNAKCSEPLEAGEYFHVINNSAMLVGAGASVDLCARGYIEPEDGTPTIYHGMPLRTELRAFVNLGGNDFEPSVLGVTPYWHPSVMSRALALSKDLPGYDHINQDYYTYQDHKDSLMEGFESFKHIVKDLLEGKLEALSAAGLSGAWSIDFMVDRGNVWLIDMSPMRSSALAEQLVVTDEFSFVSPVISKVLANEIVIDHYDVRNTMMVPHSDRNNYRYNWNMEGVS